MSVRVRVFIACLLGIAGLTLVGHTAIAKQLDNWQILPHPQHITELYFANSSRLPTKVPQDTPQHLDFIIHNIEYATTTYHYKVVATSNDADTNLVLGEGTVRLTHDQYQTIDQVIQFSLAAGTTNVRVELDYDSLTPGSKVASPQKQSINYHVKVEEK